MVLLDPSWPMGVIAVLYGELNRVAKDGEALEVKWMPPIAGVKPEEFLTWFLLVLLLSFFIPMGMFLLVGLRLPFGGKLLESLSSIDWSLSMLVFKSALLFELFDGLPGGLFDGRFNEGSTSSTFNFFLLRGTALAGGATIQGYYQIHT
jgi:hypothetical protein